MLRGERQSSSDQVRVDWGVKSGVSFVIDERLLQVRGSSLTGRPGEISPEFERSRPLAKAYGSAPIVTRGPDPSSFGPGGGGGEGAGDDSWESMAMTRCVAWRIKSWSTSDASS